MSFLKYFILLLMCWRLFVLDVYSKSPDWIHDPYKDLCELEVELCAVGEAQGLIAAELSARAALARNFETKVSSSLNFSSEASQKQDHQSTYQENMGQSISEKSDMVLEGAELLKSFEGQESVFALVRLNKKKAAKNYADILEEIDEENKALFSEKTRSNLLKIDRNLAKREEFHRFYRFLVNSERLSPISREEVQRMRAKLRAKDVKVFIALEEKFPSVLEHELISLLIAHDYRVVRRESQESDYSLKASLNRKKKFMNVRGFVKYAFELNIATRNKDNEQLGGLSLTFDEVGRNEKQALERVLDKFKKVVRNDFYKLKLD